MTAAQEMTAIEITHPGAPEVLRPARRPVPQPGPNEVLIRVAAAGVNRPDVLQRLGKYDPPPGASDLPGLEVSGIVAALGAGVTDWQIGQEVCALLAGGGYAEYCVAPAPQVLPIPVPLPLIDAAGLPETFFTVWTNLFQRGRLQPGESVLIHGGSSGIGTTAIQLARAFGARVFATAGSTEKCRVCEELGAERAIDYHTEDFVAVVKGLTGGRGVDVVLDIVGPDYLDRNVDLLAVEGRHLSVAVMSGSRATFNLRSVMLKRLTLTGSTLRARPVADKGAIAAAVLDQVWPLIAAGTVRPVIHTSFPLERAAEAHALMESSRHIGKILLTTGWLPASS
ncbi:MAG: zinc-binding dehydrogenase [Azospirillum sp.]|nr:zinc-binding dehydrogenase [Azospirillum sp.]